MVARGDLGVEMNPWDVPVIQKRIVETCKIIGRPCVIATQMMESMIENPTPTRAEASDCATAIFDSADAVMLSAESASGKYPELAVQSMSKIIRSIEENVDSIYDKNFEPDPKSVLFLSDSVIHSACVLAKNTKANAICTLTGTGYSAFTISRQRPKANIYIFSRNYELLNKLSLLWGVRGIYYERHKSTDETITDIEILLKKNGYLSPGELFITLASIPIEDRQRVNMMKISVAS